MPQGGFLYNHLHQHGKFEGNQTFKKQASIVKDVLLPDIFTLNL
jgi:hypothetical protein